MKISKYSKLFYYKPSKRIQKQLNFKYIIFSYRKWYNGNAEIFLHLLGLNLTIYLNGLKEDKQNYYKQLIKY